MIDTDIIIYSLKEHKEINLKFKEKLHIPKSISVVTYGELIYGAKKSKHVEKMGSRIEDMNLFIAATALSYNLTLVTNNIKHFENIDDLRLENWKEA